MHFLYLKNKNNLAKETEHSLKKTQNDIVLSLKSLHHKMRTQLLNYKCSPSSARDRK